MLTYADVCRQSKAKQDAVYASMFKKKSDDKDFNAAWGHGAMTGVLGGRS
jgi:hypothetical protein